MRAVVGIERATYRDAHGRLERAYRVPDPWHLAGAHEQERFAALDAYIRAHCVAPRSILEIGAGEGHHTMHLAALAADVVGIEVSGRAIRRARRRCPRATFVHGAFPDLPATLAPCFDLVIAAEVLYYVADVPRVVATMTSRGRACLATYYDREIERLDPHFGHLPGLRMDEVRVGSVRHRICLWRGRC